MQTPDPYGFGAPAPASAYAGAPDLLDEAPLVLAMAGEFLADRLEPDAEREFRLRQAALSDRSHLAAVEQDQATELVDRLARAAAQDAYDLMRHDALTSGEDLAEAGPWRGEHGPTSPHWEAPGGLAAYVRTEYAAWSRP
ncbi:hypothetical protein ACGF07_31880 [Kitasatospora sp. NPDC048194]|uniref:hypothetical protein n=1 Tax=Kitasatospora sp. NPDC048194 TaxID=3364045 RepID=UPI0037233C39